MSEAWCKCVEVCVKGRVKGESVRRDGVKQGKEERKEGKVKEEKGTLGLEN